MGQDDALGVGSGAAREQDLARVIGGQAARDLQLGALGGHQLGEQRVAHGLLAAFAAGHDDALVKPAVGVDGVVELYVAGLHDRTAGGAHAKGVLALGLQVLLVHGNQHGADLGKAE